MGKNRGFFRNKIRRLRSPASVHTGTGRKGEKRGRRRRLTFDVGEAFRREIRRAQVGSPRWFSDDCCLLGLGSLVRERGGFSSLNRARGGSFRLRLGVGERRKKTPFGSLLLYFLFFSFGLVLGPIGPGYHILPLLKKFRPRNLTYLHFQISMDISSLYHLQAPMWPLSHDYSNESSHME